VDPQSRRYIFQMIKQLKENGCTIIYASHYMEEVEQLCDDIAFIDQGQIAESGQVQHLLQQYAVSSVFIKGSHCLPYDIEQYGTLSSRGDECLLMTESPLLVMEKVLAYCRENNSRIDRLE